MKEILQAKLKEIAPLIIWEVISATLDSISVKGWLVILKLTTPASTEPLVCTIQLPDNLKETYPDGWNIEPALEKVAMTICKSCAVELVSSFIHDVEPEI